MNLLGIDVGTTNCKAGLFKPDGTVLEISSRPTVSHRSHDGFAYYDPEELWETISAVIQDATKCVTPERIASVGVTSMAETGLLIDCRTGAPRSYVIPWFDQRSMPQFDKLRYEIDAYEQFVKTGLHPSFKYGLPKIMWLRDQDPAITNGSVWLSASDYVVFRLTGEMVTDYTLAARTYAFRIDRKEWDHHLLDQFGLKSDLFPEARPSGNMAGTIDAKLANTLGLEAETPVTVAGHDHVCASLSVGAIEPGVVFDSMGTAETLVGTLESQPLGKKEYRSGLSFGCHVAPNRLFWMGSISDSGGSIEWLRTLLSRDPLSYDDVQSLSQETDEGPTGIIYYPYLSGSGAPERDAKTQGAFIGLKRTHRRSDLMKAVFEGTGYQMEAIKRVAADIAGSTIDTVLAVGGGTRNETWMQVKSDISGCTIKVADIAEAASLGAALLGAIGAGKYDDVDQAVAALGSQGIRVIHPNDQHHQAYRQLYEQGYQPLQEPLRSFYHNDWL